jgi:Na+-driven multidrug efflux pump
VRIVKLSVIVNIIQVVLVFLLAEPLVAMFSPETAEVAQLGAWGLRLYVLSVVPNTVNYIVRNYEQNMDHTASAYLICLMNHIVLPVAAGLLLVAVAPIRYIWLCFVIGQGLCLIITWFSVNGKIALKEAR